MRRYIGSEFLIGGILINENPKQMVRDGKMFRNAAQEKKIIMIFNIAEAMTKQKVNKITSPASPV